MPNALKPILRAAFASALSSTLAAPASAADDSARLMRPIYEDSSAASGKPRKDFSLDLELPLFWTSSVIGAGNDDGGGDKPDWHTFPELRLSWSHQYDRARLSAYGASAFDRYAEQSSADINELKAGAKGEFTNGSSRVFVPYARYDVVSYYERDFTSLDDRRHDFKGGFTSDVGFRGGQVIAYKDAVKPGDSTAGVNVYGGRRLATDEGSQFDVAGITLDYSVTVRKDLLVGISPELRVRWFDDIAGLPSRRDTRIGAMATANWTPDWLTANVPNSALTFSVEYRRNQSTEPGRDYEFWELGPALKLATRF